MSRKGLRRAKSEKAEETTSPRPSIFQKARSQRIPSKNPPSIDQFLLSPSKQPAKPFRWSFGTHNSNQTDLYYDKEDNENNAETSRNEKKRGKRPEHVGPSKEISASSASPKESEDQVSSTTSASPRKSLFRSLSAKAEKKSTSRPSPLQKSKSHRVPSKTPRSIDHFLLSPSQQPARKFRWSFGSKSTNQSSAVYIEGTGESEVVDQEEKLSVLEPQSIDMVNEDDATPRKNDKTEKSDNDQGSISKTSKHKKSQKKAETNHPRSSDNDNPEEPGVAFKPKQKKHIPVGRSRSPVRIDFAGRIIDSEGSPHKASRRTGEKKSKKTTPTKSSKQQRHRKARTSFSSQLRTELLQASQQLSFSNILDDSTEQPSSGRLSSFAARQSETDRNSIHKALDDLQHFEANVSRDHTLLELKKRGLEFQMDQEVSKRQKLELQFQELEEKMRRLEQRVPIEIEEGMSREVLEAENEVLLSKIHRQEETLANLQIEDYHKKHEKKPPAPPALIQVSSSELGQIQSISKAQIQGGILQANAKLAAKEALFVQQAAEEERYREELKKLGSASGVPELKEQIALLEKEKFDFMDQIRKIRESQKTMTQHSSARAGLTMSQHSHFSIPETRPIEDRISSDDDEGEFAWGQNEGGSPRKSLDMSYSSHMSTTPSIDKDKPISNEKNEECQLVPKMEDDNLCAEAKEANEQTPDESTPASDGGGIASWSSWLFGYTPPPQEQESSKQEGRTEEPIAAAPISQADKELDRLTLDL